MEGGKATTCCKAMWDRIAKGTNTTDSRGKAFWPIFESVTFGIFQFTIVVAYLSVFGVFHFR